MKYLNAVLVPSGFEVGEVSRRRFLQSVLAGGAYAGLANLTCALADEGAAGGVATSSPMASGRPSTIAQGAAMLRAAHQLLDEPRILDDPLALHIVGTASWTQLLSAPERFQGNPYLRAFIALRSRYAEDELAQAVRRGVRQYVILGAGLDTFPYRNAHERSGLRVFEVDHPATQSWKRQRLTEAGIANPGSLTFAPVNFETQTLADGLRLAGFNAGEPAYFSLLGVVIYLTQPAVMETLKFIVSLQAGSEIVFDYSVPSSFLSYSERLAREYAASRVAARGEPWITYFDPFVLKRQLGQIGFSYVEDLGSQEANDRYFRNRPDSLRIGSGRLMRARV